MADDNNDLLDNNEFQDNVDSFTRFILEGMKSEYKKKSGSNESDSARDLFMERMVMRLIPYAVERLLPTLRDLWNIFQTGMEVERYYDLASKKELEQKTKKLCELWPEWKPTYHDPRKGCWRGAWSEVDRYEDLPNNIDLRNVPFYYVNLKLENI